MKRAIRKIRPAVAASAGQPAPAIEPEPTDEPAVNPSALPAGRQGASGARPPASTGSMMSRRRQFLSLWLAVGGTSALIFALWLLLLPSQLGGQGWRELARWSVVQEATNQSTGTFKENLEKLNKRFHEITDENLRRDAAAGDRLDVAKFRAKLLEAGLNGETASPPASTDGSAAAPDAATAGRPETESNLNSN